jgi:hypothetical protein
MIELFSFFKVLKEEWNAVMQGVAIEYGSQMKRQTNVEQPMGHEKKRKQTKMDATVIPSKRVEVNDG